MAGFLACAWGVGLTVVHRLRRRRAKRVATAAQRVRAAPPPIDFYVQLEAALKRRNMARSPEQTPREFVVAACGELAELPTTRGVSNLPRKIVEAFYRVRFGGRPLSDAERAEIDQALAQLASALEPAPARSPA
jgi:protein-glutamine gamma-glutamyltransferase